MAESFNTKLDKVGFAYLEKLNARVTKTSFTRSIKENLYYPSLFSLTSTLEQYGIESLSLKVDNYEIEKQIPPFIVLFKDKKGVEDFILIEEFGDDIVYNIDGRKKVRLNRDEFKNGFKNVVFIAETDAHSGESNYAMLLRQEKFIKYKRNLLNTSFIVCFVSVVVLFVMRSGNYFSAVTLSFLLSSGLLLCALLVLFEFNKSNRLLKSICTGINEKANCDAVLNSKVSKLLGISWGELGLLFFTGLAIFAFTVPLPFQIITSFLAIILTGAAFYIPFSIYYQGVVAKEWCLLCVGVQFLLLIGLFWSVKYYWLYFTKTNISLQSSFYFLLSFLFPVTTWFFIKPVLLHYKNIETESIGYKKLAFNPEMFMALLMTQPKAAEGWQQLGINIGNPNAEISIIKVCNPYCGPCAAAHPRLEEIIETNKNVSIKVIFTVTKNINDVSNNPARHLLAIAHSNDSEFTKKALDDWYLNPNKNYEAFANRFPTTGPIDIENQQLREMETWCKASEITYTPTIFINGRRLPANYSINDLKKVL